MKNKIIFIMRLLYSSFITLFLIYIFIKASNFKIMIVPFIMCSLAMFGKNLCLLANKIEYVNKFNKLYIISFLLYWYGILNYCCYYSLINKEYSILIISLPFWIVGFYIIRRFLFENSPPKIRIKINIKILATSFLTMFLIIGIAMLFFGIKNTYKMNKISKNYITTNGYFVDYDIYSSDEEGTTYKLIYIYKVKDKEYTITTDYGTNYIPTKNSIREVKYNPENPKEAILVGTNNKNSFIFIGIFFTLIPLIFIVGMLSERNYFKKLRIDIEKACIGIVLLILGIGVIILQTGTTHSLIEAIKSLGGVIFIVIMFIVVGIYLLINCLFYKNRKI